MQPGQKVCGEYHGMKFSGVITAVRAITVATDGALESKIKLDAPIEVYGTTRNSILVFSKFDGSPTSYAN